MSGKGRPSSGKINTPKLSLDISFSDSLSLDETYRREGLSVGASHLRFLGEDVKMEVTEKDIIIGRRIGQGDSLLCVMHLI
jgi:hypothetical protein